MYTMIHRDEHNFFVLYDLKRRYCLFKPKPGTGCRSGVFGSLNHCKWLLKMGIWKETDLTPTGRALLIP